MGGPANIPLARPFSVPQLAHRWGCSEGLIRKMIRDGRLQCFRPGTLIRISAAKPEGRELTPDVWKALFMHSLDHEQRFEMALDGKGFVPLGFRSSKLSKEQMSDLFALIEEYAARHGIELEEPR